ncbi:MAG: MBL fold metallo-hydrolase [Alphaproteobacteria bacterium]
MTQKTAPLKVRILGCGPTWGVPCLGFGWGKCNPDNPKNRRQRSSILVEDGTTRLLIDASPDARAQLFTAKVDALDAILLTHEHADHTRGLDELGALSRFQDKLLPIHASPKTFENVIKSVDYAFHAQNAHYLPFFSAHPFSDKSFTVGSLTIQPFLQDHGVTESWGFRIGDFAYSTDVVKMPEESFQVLEGVKVWVVDCLKRVPHLTHSHLTQTLEWIERVKPDRAILTHMSQDLDYDQLKAELPSHVEPAYDGLEIMVKSGEERKL